MNTTTFDSPLGRLTLVASAQGLTRCTLRAVTVAADPAADDADEAARGWLTQAADELDGYFAGGREEFTVPVDLARVAAPQRRILEALSTIGYGRRTTYGELARRLELVDDGARKVGGAMARNPVLIIVPCHRVLGAGGRLTGYAGGLPAKQWLLDMEARHADIPTTQEQLTLAW
jgi:methylated-DNA-[protein]-cysteine S-methyltransferase